MASNIAAFLGWSFLPDFVTGNLQSFYYSLTIRAGEPRPQPNTPLFQKHRRRIHVTVLLLYLFYTLYEAHWEVRRDGDFYSILGVSPDVDDKTLQSRFRRLTLLYHPDKITRSEDLPAAETFYVHLKLARDTLLDPARRFAYDRFGPDVTQWRDCITVRDFLTTGLRATMPWYVGTGLVMLVMNYLGLLNWGTYWRYLAFAALAAFELGTLTRPDFPTLLPPALAALVPRTSILAAYKPVAYLPFQTLRVARKAIITLFIALSRLGPLLSAPLTPGAAPADLSEDEKMGRQMQRLEQAVAMGGMESARLLALETVPFQGGVGDSTASLASQSGVRELRDQVKEWLVTNTVRNDAQVRSAVSRVLDKRRTRAEGEIVPE